MSTEPQYNVSDFVQSQSTNLGEKLDLAVDELQAEKAHLATLEMQFNAAAERVSILEEQIIPDLMEEAGWGPGSRYVTPSGETIELRQDVNASVKASYRQEVYQWLDERGHGGMIKRKVIVPFGRDDERAVTELSDSLRARYPQVGQEMKVEPQTFAAFVRSQLEQGEAIPPAEMLNIEHRRWAKIR